MTNQNGKKEWRVKKKIIWGGGWELREWNQETENCDLLVSAILILVLCLFICLGRVPQLLNPQNSCSKTAVSGPERWQRPENYRFDQDRQSPKHQSLDHWVYCASEGLGFNIQDSNLLKKYVFYFTYSHWVWRLLLIGGRQDGRHKTYFNKLTTLHKFAQMKAAEVATII